MEYDTYLIDTKADDKVLALYSELMELMKEHEHLNETAMSILQSLGYNGFKRWHRYRSRQFHEYFIRLNNEVFDRFHKSVKIEYPTISYATASISSHLMNWKEKLESSMKELAEYSHQYFESMGVCSDIINCAMYIMTRDYEKVCRYYDRFTEGDWLAHDMHVVDDMIHYKFKKKENKHGYKY